MKILNWTLAKNKKEPEKRQSKILSKTPDDRIKMEMSTLNTAVEEALDPTNPNRSDLLLIYAKAWKDAQVIAEREKAESFIIAEPFEVLENGNASEDKKKLFERPWFESFLKIALSIEFWGHTIAEFQEQDENGEFLDVKTFPRKNIRPFEKLIVQNPTDREGIPYEDDLYDFFMIEMGDPSSLGKLEPISREIIWKNFSRSDWSEYNERFGKPMLDFAIDTDDEKEIERKEEMARNFGSNLYMLRDVNEEVTIHQFSVAAAGENFEKSARFCDEQIAKMMNGQMGTSDEKSFVGAAEVHERILSTFNKARLKNIENLVNYELIPFLTYHGYPLVNCQISYPVLKKSNSPASQQDSLSQLNKKKKDQPDWVLNM